MGRGYEVDGYTAELDDDLQVVYRNPRGKKLQQAPGRLADTEGVRRLYRLRRALTGHRRHARLQAEAWATAGTRVPMALADSDPVWCEALDDAGVEPAADPPAPDADEAALIARTYAHPDDHTMTLLLRAPFARHWDALVASQEDWALTDTFATGIRVPGDTELTFPERLMAAHPGREQEALEAAYAFGWSLWGSPLLHKSILEGDLAHRAATAPGFLPDFLDELADMCLKAGGQRKEHATGYFTRARNAEREHHTKPDERWLDARYAARATRTSSGSTP